MVAGNRPGVRALVSAAELPVPPPPGVTLVPARDPWQTAGDVTRALCATRLFTAAEACEELDRRREAALDLVRRQAALAAEGAEAAREEAAAARRPLPPALAGVSPDRLRRTARAVEEAVAAVRAARASLGPRPRLDQEVAHEAREAQVLVDVARHQRAALLPRANRVLAVANAGGAAVVAGRVASEAFDPVFVLVAALPAAGLGAVAWMVAGTVRRSRSAARRRWAALRSLDVCTLAALDAREADVRTWDARAARIADLRRQLVRLQAAWEQLVGPGVRVGEAASLAAALEEVARLEAEAAAAGRASAEMAQRLQELEAAGVAGAPLVVVDADSGGRPEGRERRLRALAARAGRTPVVVVSAVAAPAPAAPVPAPAPAAPAPAGGEEPAVVDLRERVLAGLLRLRARQAPRRSQSPPGTAASG